MNNSFFSSVRIALNATLLCQNVMARKSKIFTTLFFVFSIFMLKAQPWKQLPISNTTTFGSNLLGIHFVDDQIGYVVGTSGTISKTTDGGVNWVSQNIGSTTLSLYAIYFIDANTGFTVGDGGYIRRTDDGGANWQTVTITNPPANASYRAVWFYNAYEGYIVGGVSGSSGAILKTVNGGLNWTNISPSPNNLDVIYGIFFTDALTGYATDFNGRILKTTNGGLTWPLAGTIFSANNNLHGIYFTSKDTGYVVGGNTTTRTGIILKTENAGLTWGLPYPTPTDGFLTGLSFFGNAGFAVGGHPTLNTSAVIYKTVNITTGNNVWTPQTIIPISGTPVSRQYRVSLPCSHTGYSCGINGTILKINGIGDKICCDTFTNSFANTNFTFTNTPPSNLYFFARPSGTLATDILNWDFGDGQTGQGPRPQHTYPTASGSYLVTLCIQRPQANGDTCKVKLCQLISTHPCPNLVKNGDFSLGNDGSFTSALPNGSSCNGTCQVGAYCVSNNFTTKCNTWPSSFDHTYSTSGGSFMSIDGNTSVNGPVNIWRHSTLIPVNMNTTYKFSFWAKSIYTTAQQVLNIDMAINGTALKAVPNTLSTSIWKEYIMIWNSGSATTADLAIRQLTPAAFSDFGIDDISFCCVDCEDFMTEVMNYGIQSTLVSGNTYKYCVSPNVSTSDIVQWDMDCNGTVDATTSTPCQNFTLTSANSQICATVLHVIKPGDTCRVKVKACLPNISSKPCVCDSTFFTSVDAGFTWVKNSPFSITFTPVNLLNNCDSVKWTFGNAGATASSIGSASVTYTYPSVIGNYQVCMLVTRTDLNGKVCRKEFCLTININGLVSLVEVSLPNLTFKPNPATNSVIVTMPPSLNSPKNMLRLSTIDGRILKTVSVESTETIMDLEILPAGLYFISLVDNEGKMLTRPSKLVKQ
jgi:photosystem II stability/assembly factor-like uncharacterized protein